MKGVKIRFQSEILDFFYEHYEIYYIEDDPQKKARKAKEYLYIKDAKRRITYRYRTIYFHRKSGELVLAKHDKENEQYMVLHQKKQYVFPKDEFRRHFKRSKNLVKDSGEFDHEYWGIISGILKVHWPKKFSKMKYYPPEPLLSILNKRKVRYTGNIVLALKAKEDCYMS